MSKIKNTGYKALVIVEDIGLLVIAISTIIAMSFEIGSMFTAMKVTLADLLLLFIYRIEQKKLTLYLPARNAITGKKTCCLSNGMNTWNPLKTNKC